MFIKIVIIKNYIHNPNISGRSFWIGQKMGHNKILSIFIFVILIVSSVSTPLAYASHSAGTSGNITTCTPPLISILVDPAVDGTYSSGSFSITVDFSADGKFVDWTSTHDINTVYAKGGNAYNTYSYPGTTDFLDTGLHSPNAGGSGQPAAFSHILFCLDPNAPPQDLCLNVDCSGAGNACNTASCDPTTGMCTILTPVADGTACGDPSDTVCDNPDSCVAGSCQANYEPTSTTCRADAGECDVAEACDGAGTCPVDGFEPAGTACGDPSDTVCDNPDSCSGTANTCLPNYEPTSTTCRADAGECDVAEACDGAGTCPVDGFEPAGTACGDPSDTECTNPDACNESGTCLENNEADGTACGDQGVDCHVDDECVSGECQDNGIAIDGADCSIGQCGAGVCEFIIDKFYTYTNNNWNLRCGTTEFPAHVEGDQCIDDGTGLPVPFRFANVDEDGYSNIFANQLPPPPDDGNDPFYLLGELKGKKTVINPGQYIAVSLIDILKEEPITVTEDFSDCSDASVNFIGNINPPKAPGGVQVVLILANGDVLDIDDLLAAGIGGSITFGDAGGSALPDSAIVSITDWNALGTALGIADLNPEMGQLRVMVKFQPNDRTTPPLIGTSCTNIESVSNAVNYGMDTADLTVIPKPK
jgi:hypothetical protein